MPRILLRAGKSPFETISPATVYWNDLIAKNSGNLLFAHSAYKTLSAPGVEIDVTRYRNPLPKEADEINEKYDKFVIPLANAFRGDFEPQLKSLTAFIRKLKIPCIVVGVGAQAEIDADPRTKRKLDETAKAFLSAVLDRSHSIGVRGEFTKAYLNGLGFDAVKVIGCPSMFLYGDRLSVTKTDSAIDEHSSISINLTGNMPPNIVPLYESVFSRHLNATYIPQNRADLSLLLWGQPAKAGREGDPLPRDAQHPVIASGRARYFTDVTTWIDFLKTQQFSFGTRIHGNVFAILAGTPGYVIAHDSRTLELARYFEIPHRKVSDVKSTTTVAELFDEADYSPLLSNHKQRFGTYKSFLEDNGIDHIFAHRSEAEVFEARLNAINLPGPIRPIGNADVDEVRRRTAELADLSSRRVAELESELAAARKIRQNIAESAAVASPSQRDGEISSAKKVKARWWPWK